MLVKLPYRCLVVTCDKILLRLQLSFSACFRGNSVTKVLIARGEETVVCCRTHGLTITLVSLWKSGLSFPGCPIRRSRKPIHKEGMAVNSLLCAGSSIE
jgi:hypothetical protein